MFRNMLSIATIGVLVLGVCLVAGGASAIAGEKSDAHSGGNRETGRISGNVTDSEGAPLGYANIFIRVLGSGTVSSMDGEFVLRGLHPGRHIVSVTYIGYKPQSVNVEVEAGKTVHVEFSLEQTMFELEPIVVTGSPGAVDPMKSPQDISYVSGREKLRRQSASLGKTIEAIPGVANISTGGVAGKPVIRGHTGERIRILVGGISQEYQQYGERHAPNADPFNYERIELIKGAASLLYGSDAIGGAINLIPLRQQFSAPSESFLGGQIMGRYSSVSDEKTAGLRLKGGSGRFGFHGSFTVRESGNIRTPDEPTFAESGERGDPKFTDALDHTDYQQYAGTLALGYKSDAGIITTSYDHWWNQNNYLLPTGGPIGLGLENRICSMKGYFPAGRFVIKPALSYQWNHRQATSPGLSREFIPDSSKVDLELDVYTLRVDVNHQDTGPFSGTMGVELRYYDHENLGQVPLQPSGYYANAAVYVFEEISLDDYTLNAGLRFDYRRQKFYSSETNPLLPEDDKMDYFNIASSFGVSRGIGGHLTAVANVNQGFRIPSFFNSYVYGLHGGVFAFQIGEPDLSPEISLDFSTGLRFSSRRTKGSVTAYFDYIRDYIYLYNAPDHPLAPPISEYQFVFAHSQDDAAITGVDFRLDINPIDWLVVGGDLSLISSRFLGGPHEDSDLPLMPAAKYRGKVCLLLPEYGAVRKPSLDFEFQYSSSKDAAGIYEPFGQFDDGIGPDIPFGVTSTDGYLLLNAGLSFDIVFGQGTVYVDIEVTNLTNEAYRDFLDTYKGYALGPGRGVNVTLNVPLWYQ